MASFLQSSVTLRSASHSPGMSTTVSRNLTPRSSIWSLHFYPQSSYSVRVCGRSSVLIKIISPPLSLSQQHPRILTLPRGHLPLFVQIGEEEADDERGLAQAILPHHHQREVKPSLHTFLVHLFWQGGEPNKLLRILKIEWGDIKKKKWK